MNKRPILATVALALVALALVVAPCALLTGCGEAPSEDNAPQTAPVEVKVASLKGPTSIGLVDLMEDARAGQTEDTYDFQVKGTADEVVQEVVSGDVDIALVPANVAAVLYQKTDGKVQAIDINTLSVLDCVTRDASVTDFASLAGKTVYLTGKGTTPQYVMEYLLGLDGIAGSVTLEYKSEATEVVAALSSDPDAVAILPQPFATAALSKVDGATSPFGLGEVWEQLAPEGSQLVTGVTIVRSEFLAEHPEAVTRFVEGQKASVETVLADPAAASQLVVDEGIVDNAKVAEKAIPHCGLTCTTGDEMKTALNGYLSVLFDADPASVGGGMPEDDFYWLD